MKRLAWSAVGIMTLGIAVLLAVSQVEQSRMLDMPSMMPDGALLYLQSRDFRSLLKDWNTSEQKRAWLSGDNYQAFSRSRLFERLSQAQDEFSAAAGLKTDSSLLDSVAGRQSSLGLYDIGNLEFIYVTRMDQHDVDSTPLWQLRAKFEPRTEVGTQFFVHQDAQSNRTAAFAAKDGWLILGTSERLVAGVLDRMQTTHARSLADDSWYANAVKQAFGPPDDLRMVLNLEKIVATPYFSSYWVQRNITEMKQYTSALSDLHRSAETYREERVLLRKTGLSAAASGDVQTIAALAPEEAAFYSAQASPEAEGVLTALRENLLEMKPAQAASRWSAPSATTAENAGSASMLEEHIDQAPVIVRQADVFLPLRTLLRATELQTLLEVYGTHASPDGVFVGIDRGTVIGAATNWNEASVQESLTAALQPKAYYGTYWSGMDQAIGHFRRLLCSRRPGTSLCCGAGEVVVDGDRCRATRTYAQADQECCGIQSQWCYLSCGLQAQPQRATKLLERSLARLDKAGHSTTADANADASAGQSPAFFSGNIASLSNMFSSVNMETVSGKRPGLKGYADGYLPMEARVRMSPSVMAPWPCWALLAVLMGLSCATGSGENAQSKLFSQSVSAQLKRTYDDSDLSWLVLDLQGNILARHWQDVMLSVAPGSLVKPFVAVAYGEQHDGRFPHVHCAGSRDRCWLPKGHGTPGIESAIAQSCNAYFLTLAGELDRNRAQQTFLRFGLKGPPPDASRESLIGLGSAWRETPLALATAYLRLTSLPEQGARLPIVTGMRASASSGTAHGVDAALGVNAALAKTGTAACSHHPRAAADGFAMVLYPAEQPRILLFLRKHGATGADAATVAGEMLRSIGMGYQ